MYFNVVHWWSILHVIESIAYDQSNLVFQQGYFFKPAYIIRHIVRSIPQHIVLMLFEDTEKINKCFDY